MHLEFESKSRRKKTGTIILTRLLFAKNELGMYSIVFLRRLVKLDVQNEGLGHMNVLGKPTYLCTLKAQPG